MDGSKPTIWIIEDETDILELEQEALKQNQFLCQGFKKAYDFMQAWQTSAVKPDLVILDIMLPDRNGLDLIRWIREKSKTTAILCISARGEEMDKIIGLDLGADDYLPKPFSPREMVSRIKAILRRSQGEKTAPSSSQILTWEGIQLDMSKFEATIDGVPIVLTATEFRLLAILLEKPGQVFTREILIERLWNNEKAIMDRTIDAHIKNLREKLGIYETCLQTLRGIGYKLDRPKNVL